MPVYTIADWHVKPGREQEFVDYWQRMAEWVRSDFNPSGWGKLLRDKEDPTHFTSLGEWQDANAVERMRGSDGFRQRADEIADLADGWSVRTLDVAAEVGRIPARA